MLPGPLRYLVQAVLGLSLLTLLGGTLYLAFSLLRKRGVGIMKVLTTVAGILTAAGTLVLKGSGAKVTTLDESRNVVVAFYDDVQRKEFSQAYDLIHDARKQEMKGQGRGYDDFRQAYASTRDYRNIQIDFDQAESPTSRLYWVSFDVKDSFPESRLMEESWLPSGRMMDAGLINESKLLETVMADLGQSYEVPPTSAPQVRDYVRKAPLHYVLEPSFVEDVGDALHLNRRPVNGSESWSHHIEHVKLQTDNGWKIRGGLYPDVFAATYPPGAEHPSHSAAPSSQ